MHAPYREITPLLSPCGCLQHQGPATYSLPPLPSPRGSLSFSAHHISRWSMVFWLCGFYCLPTSSKSLRQSRMQILASEAEGLGSAEVQKRFSSRGDGGQRLSRCWWVRFWVFLICKCQEGVSWWKGTWIRENKNGGLDYMKVILIAVFDWTSYESFVSNYSAAQEHTRKSHKVPKCS